MENYSLLKSQFSTAVCTHSMGWLLRRAVRLGENICLHIRASVYDIYMNSSRINFIFL